MTRALWGTAKRVKNVLFSARARQNLRFERRRHRTGTPRLYPTPQRILVVCHGNICRSPFAAALIAARFGAAGFEVRSAGLYAGEGALADDSAKRTALRFGADLDAHRARHFESSDLEWADLTLVMEGHQALEIVKRFPSGDSRVCLLGDFLPGPPFTIDDPFGRSDSVFVSTFERIALAVDGLIECLKQTPSLDATAPERLEGARE